MQIRDAFVCVCVCMCDDNVNTSIVGAHWASFRRAPDPPQSHNQLPCASLVGPSAANESPALCERTCSQCRGIIHTRRRPLPVTLWNVCSFRKVCSRKSVAAVSEPGFSSSAPPRYSARLRISLHVDLGRPPVIEVDLGRQPAAPVRCSSDEKTGAVSPKPLERECELRVAHPGLFGLGILCASACTQASGLALSYLGIRACVGGSG